MPSIKKYTPKSEAELHLLIEKDLDALEDGLTLLQHEYPTGKGVIDFLCADSGHRLVIVEIKLHEDENIPFQALRYFSVLDKDRYLVANAFAAQHVDPEESPRIILVAEAFSEDLRRLSTLVMPDIELFEYTAVAMPNDDRGVVFHPVSLPTPERPPAEPKTVDNLIEYLRDEHLKPTLANMRTSIKGLGKGIEEYATQGYIGYKHTGGRQFAYIRIYRTSLEFGAHNIDEKRALLGYESIRVQAPKEDYSPILEKIKASFINLGGKLSQ
jgi:hypothetical protein